MQEIRCSAAGFAALRSDDLAGTGTCGRGNEIAAGFTAAADRATGAGDRSRESCRLCDQALAIFPRYRVEARPDDRGRKIQAVWERGHFAVNIFYFGGERWVWPGQRYRPRLRTRHGRVRKEIRSFDGAGRFEQLFWDVCAGVGVASGSTVLPAAPSDAVGLGEVFGAANRDHAKRFGE